MGDRIAVMNRGELQQVGEPHEVYTNPSNLFVANFVGSPGMNFLGCKMVKKQSGEVALQLQTDSTLLSIPEKLNNFFLEQYQKGQDLVLGIRPEHVKLSSEMRENHIPTMVFIHEKMGSYHLVGLKYGQEILRARTPATNKFAIDETAFVSFDMDNIRLFDSQTEQSLLQ
jgi:multiple sugar transport system ATP-binding protein